VGLRTHCHDTGESWCSASRVSVAPQIAKKPYQFLLVSALREYLTLEFEPPLPLAFPYDPERIIDDFGARRCSHAVQVYTLLESRHWVWVVVRLLSSLYLCISSQGRVSAG
jgi:hypothetical protein